MSSQLLGKLKQHDLIYSMALAGAALLPILLKIMVSRALGPDFMFYFCMVWLPAVTLFLSFFRGWKEASFTGSALLLAMIVSILSLPLDPPMDFRRQIISHAYLWISCAVVVSWGFQILFPRLQKLRS